MFKHATAASCIFSLLLIQGSLANSCFSTTSGGVTVPVTNVFETLQSPNYPEDYPKNLDCLWIFKALDNDSIVELEVLDSVLEESDATCTFDYIAAYDGNAIDDTLLRKWCRTDTPTIYSSGQYIALRFFTDEEGEEKGFRIQYRQVSENVTLEFCSDSTTGGTVTSALNSPGIIMSPNYPLSYSSYADCLWVLKAADDNHIIRLVVLYSLLPPSDPCNGDYVAAYDGASMSAVQLRRWCGKESPMVYSSGRYLTVEFRADGSEATQGFNIQFQQVPGNTSLGICPSSFIGGATLPATNTTSILTSINYPDNYDRNMDCSWTLVASHSSMVIELVVLDSEIDNSSSCSVDYAAAYDGPNPNDPLIQKWCGTETPTMYSTGQALTLRFDSNGDIQAKGFRVQYRQILGGTGNSSPVNCPSSSNGGTRILVGNTADTIRSPMDFSRKMNCLWIFEVTDVYYNLEISFNDFLIQNSSTCSSNYAAVYDGQSSNATLLKKWCGNETPSIRSSGRYLTLVLHTESSAGNQGFHLDYQQVFGGEKLKAFSYTQNLQSPNYTAYYMSNMDVAWVLQTNRSDYVVEIHVLDSSIEPSSSCAYDYVAAFDGPTTSSPLLKKWCGTESPTVYSTSQFLTLAFHTDDFSQYRGFSIDYREVAEDDIDDGCPAVGAGGSPIAAESTTRILQSPNYPGNYGSNLDCMWVLEAQDPSFVIEVVVLESHLQQTNPCSSDYLVAYDGPNESSVLLDTWCGDQTPNVYSTGRFMSIRFTTDLTVESSGFRIQYQQIPADNHDKCGTADNERSAIEVDSSGGILVSPNYPSNYARDMDCVWVLQAITDESVIQFSILEAHIQQCPSCSCDYLAVYDGQSDMSPSLGRFCDTTGITVNSTGKYLAFRFKSDGLTEYSGYRIQYRQISAGRSTTTTTSPSTDVRVYTDLEIGIFGLASALVIIMTAFFLKKYVLKRRLGRTTQNTVSVPTASANVERGTPRPEELVMTFVSLQPVPSVSEAVSLAQESSTDPDDPFAPPPYPRDNPPVYTAFPPKANPREPPPDYPATKYLLKPVIPWQPKPR